MPEPVPLVSLELSRVAAASPRGGSGAAETPQRFLALLSFSYQSQKKKAGVRRWKKSFHLPLGEEQDSKEGKG